MNISVGRILYIDEQYAWKAVGYIIYQSSDDGKSWRKVITIPAGLMSRFKSMFSLTRRLFRKGVYKMMEYKDTFLVFSDNSIFVFRPSENKLEFIGYIKGSRPLYACVFGNKLYYGEYKSNENREKIPIHSYDLVDGSWEIAAHIDGIRHIHGVFADSFEKKIWVTTGDFDHECMICYTDDGFETIKTFVSGSQDYRAIYLHFSKDTISFGTDAPDRDNYIRTLSRSNGEVITETKVGGPVFFGGVLQNLKILTTVVEPSVVNTNQYAELWLLDAKRVWKKVLQIKKDILPKKLFQYGQIWVPEGPGSVNVFWFTPIACSTDYKAICVSVREIGLIDEIL